jgi:hypothetical protein
MEKEMLDLLRHGVSCAVRPAAPYEEVLRLLPVSGRAHMMTLNGHTTCSVSRGASQALINRLLASLDET